MYEREFFRQFVCFYVDIKSSNGEKLLNNQSVHSREQNMIATTGTLLPLSGNPFPSSEEELVSPLAKAEEIDD